MATYYIWGANGKKVFNVKGRLQELLNKQNQHPHHNNYNWHGGNGGPNEHGTWAAKHLEQNGSAVYTLPNNGYHYYTEVVWNPPGLDAGVTRVILGQGGEMYLTNDHYHVYYKIFEEEEGTHTKFNEQGAKHTFFPQ